MTTMNEIVLLIIVSRILYNGTAFYTLSTILIDFFSHFGFFSFIKPVTDLRLLNLNDIIDSNDQKKCAKIIHILFLVKIWIFCSF